MCAKLFRESGKDQAGGGKNVSIEVGQWGGNGGFYWDDGIYNGVREINLTYDHCIDSIHVVYDKNGKPVAGEKHGGVGGTHRTEIKLQWPEEFLTSVSGHYCPMVPGIGPVIRSLTFKSNKRTYGPYGMEVGTPFSFSIDGALVVGLNGRCGWYLDSIGFHLTVVQSPKLLKKVKSRLKKFMNTAPPSDRFMD